MKHHPSLREAAEDVVSHIDGDLPIRGWLKDTDASRAALGKLRAALAAMEDKKCPVGIDWCPQGNVEP